MRITEDVIFQIDRSGNWILYNVFTHDTVVAEPALLPVLSELGQIPVKTFIKKYAKAAFKLWEIGIFSNTDGLLADPTKRIRDRKKWPKPVLCDGAKLIELLETHRFTDQSDYDEYLKLKTSILDKKHFGNFHQQLGQALLIEKRVDPTPWWVKQKFTANFKELNETLYKAVQGNFLKDFFMRRFKKGDKVLDIGSGVGYYTKLMGKSGAEVLGIDPTEEYVDIARKGAPANVRFERRPIGNKGDLNSIPDHSFDYIFIQDTLLFYFVPYIPQNRQDIKVLFNDVKRLLKPGGRFFVLEPHGHFWLRPWLGEEDRPFTVITEYFKKLYNVTPNYSELIKSFLDNGLRLRDFKELSVDPDFSKKDRRAAKFAEAFPLWWFFELEAGQ